MSSTEAKLIYQKYEEMLELLRSYRDKTYRQWVGGVDQDCHFNLGQPLILRSAVTGLIQVNFSKAVGPRVAVGEPTWDWVLGARGEARALWPLWLPCPAKGARWRRLPFLRGASTFLLSVVLSVARYAQDMRQNKTILESSFSKCVSLKPGCLSCNADRKHQFYVRKNVFTGPRQRGWQWRQVRA